MHCVKTWGEDFRSAYQELDKLRDMFPKVPILALTATATHETRVSLAGSLKMHRDFHVF